METEHLGHPNKPSVYIDAATAVRIFLLFIFLVVSGLIAGINIWILPWLLMLITASVPFLMKEGFVKDPLSIIYLFIIYLFLGIGMRGLLIQVGAINAEYNAPSSNDLFFAYAYLLTATALLSLYAGYFLRKWTSLERWLKKNIYLAEARTSSLDNFFSLLCAIIGLISFAVFFFLNSDVIEFGRNPNKVAEISYGGGIYFITMLAHFPVVGALLTISKRMKPSRVILFAVNFIFIFFWFAIMSRKGLLTEFLIGLVIVYHYRVKRLKLKSLLIIGFLAFSLVTATFYYRWFGIDYHSGASVLEQQGLIRFLIEPVLGRSYHIDVFIIIIDKVRSFGDLKLGSTLNELLFFFIPRGLWPEKPLSFGYTFGSDFLNYVDNPSAFSTSLIGELYLNFYIPGIIFGFFLIGRFMRSVYEGLVANGSGIAIVLYGIICYRLVHMVEGPIAAHLIFTLASLLPFMLYFLLRFFFSAKKLP